MALLPPNMDYSDRDFESLRARLFDLIPSVFPKWTASQVHNFGNLIVEAHCFVGDVLNFYQDQQAPEGRWTTVQMRKNMIALAKLVSEVLFGRVAATADVTLTITNAADLTGLVVPVATPVVVGTTAITSPVNGEIQDVISFDLSLGETSKTFGWEHSETQTPYTVASSGKATQKILLPFSPVLVQSVGVSTPTQGPWTRVDTFYGTGPNDPVFKALLDQNDYCQVVFGNGKNGVVPVGNVTHVYKTGGGPSGNVEAGSLTKIQGDFQDTEGRKAIVVSTNAVDAEGGLGREEVEAGRERIPRSVRVSDRTVAREDYEINAERVEEVGRSLMLTSNEDPTILENRGKLFIIPKTGGTPSQSILDDVYQMCTVLFPNTVTFQLDVLAAVYLTVNVEVIIYLQTNRQNSSTWASDAKAAVVEALEDYFEPMLADGTKNTNVDFGYYYRDEDDNPAGEVAWSDVANVIRDQRTYVRKIDPGPNGLLLNGLRGDIGISNWLFPELGTVKVINGATGTEI